MHSLLEFKLKLNRGGIKDFETIRIVDVDVTQRLLCTHFDYCNTTHIVVKKHAEVKVGCN